MIGRRTIVWLTVVAAALPMSVLAIASVTDAAPARKAAKRHGGKCPRRGRRGKHHRRLRLKPTPARCHASAAPLKLKAHKGSKRVKQVSTKGAPPAVTRSVGSDAGSDRRLRAPAGPLITSTAHSIQPDPTPTEGAALDRGAAPDSGPVAKTATGALSVIRNRDLRSGFHMPVAGPLRGNDGGEQSVATNGPSVLYTTNYGDAVSTDGGFSFSYLDPSTAFGGASAPKGGFCCDQVVQFLPRIGRWVWVLQYWPGSSGNPSPHGMNVIRVATASQREFLQSGGHTWHAFDFTPHDFGFSVSRRSKASKATLFLDQSSIAYANRRIYITAGVFRGKNTLTGGTFNGTVVLRFGDRELARGAISSYQYLRLPTAMGWVRPAEAADPARAKVQFFAGEATTSRLAVIRWPGAGVPQEFDVDVATIAGDDSATKDPDGNDWMARYGKSAGEVRTGAQTGNSLIFGWAYGRKASVIAANGSTQEINVHAQPGLGFAVLNTNLSPPKLVAGSHIQFANAAAALPQLRADKAGDSAVSFEFGGPGGYPSHAVGFLIGYAAATTVAGSHSAREPQEGGDYTGLANIPNTRCFAAAGSATKFLNIIDPHYVVFSRPGQNCNLPVVPLCRTVSCRPPDLVVDRVYGSASDMCSIYADVHNVGSGFAPATKTRFQDLANPSTFDQVVDTPSLSPGQAATVQLPRSFGQNNSALVTADATNVVQESNENNNTNSGSGYLSTNGNCHYP